MRILLVLFTLFPGLVSYTQSLPTPSYNLLTYKIAELYKRGADEKYIARDLATTSLGSNNYSLEQSYYERSDLFLSQLSSKLLFNDPGYQLYCSNIGLDTTNALKLFKEELDYRKYLTTIGAPYFVYDPLRTLKDFDTTLLSSLNFYYGELSRLADKIERKEDLEKELRNITAVQIKPTEQDAQVDIDVADKRAQFYKDEVEYYKGILGRYDGILTASQAIQKSLSKAIQDDLSEMDKLGASNTGLLSSAISSFSGLPDPNQISTFIAHPNLAKALDLAVEAGGSQLVDNVANSVSFTGNMAKAYKDISGIYAKAKDYYGAYTKVKDFIATPSIDNFINLSTDLAAVSGRKDLIHVVETIEKGRDLWSQISGCAGNVTCDCLFKLINTAGTQSPRIKNYAKQLRDINFNCQLVDQVVQLAQHPTLEMIENLVREVGNIPGLDIDLSSIRELKTSFNELRNKSVFAPYIGIGEQFFSTLSATSLKELENEVFQKKQLFVLIDIVLSQDSSNAKKVIDAFIPKSNATEKGRKLLEIFLKERTITVPRALKLLLQEYPSVFCDAIPSGVSQQIQKMFQPALSGCSDLSALLSDPKNILDSIVFLDKELVFRSKHFQADMKEALGRAIDKFLQLSNLPGDIQLLARSVINNNLPQLKVGVDPTANTSLEKEAFEKLLGAPPGSQNNPYLNEMMKANLGLYAYSKVQSKNEFQQKINSENHVDSIAKYEQPPADSQDDKPKMEDVLKDMLIKGTISYFAPGALQTAQIVSNIMAQGQLADAVQNKNEQLSAEVKNYVDKSMERDQYQTNIYRSEHEKVINELVAAGKRKKYQSLSDAGETMNFQRQQIGKQLESKSSYYYFLLERVRETFVKYLWAYRKWYGRNYADDELEDPNTLRLILDPQVRYLTFFQYVGLGDRKGDEVLDKWKSIIPLVNLRHKSLLEDRSHLSELITTVSSVQPDNWHGIREWLRNSRSAADTGITINLAIDLLDQQSASDWAIGFGTDMRECLFENKNTPLPYGLRLIGLNVGFVDAQGKVIAEANQLFSQCELSLDPSAVPIVNYGDQFYGEVYKLGSLDFRINNDFFFDNRAAVKKSYYSTFQGVPLNASYNLKLKKRSNEQARLLREKVEEIEITGLYFLNTGSSGFVRTNSPMLPVKLSIDGNKRTIKFSNQDILIYKNPGTKIISAMQNLEKLTNGAH